MMAIIHSVPFWSTHIGSTCGDGPSGTHVQPFVPACSPRMSHVMIVASFEIDSGAADRALLISSSSVVGGLTVPAAGAAAWLCVSAGGVAAGGDEHAASPANSTTSEVCL